MGNCHGVILPPLARQGHGDKRNADKDTDMDTDTEDTQTWTQYKNIIITWTGTASAGEQSRVDRQHWGGDRRKPFKLSLPLYAAVVRSELRANFVSSASGGG